MAKRYVCRSCRHDTEKRLVVHRKKQEIVSISREDQDKWGIIGERICKNIAKWRTSWFLLPNGVKKWNWIEDTCENHILRIKQKVKT